MAELIATDRLEDFNRLEMTLLGETRTVFSMGSGPAVIVMSEMPGIHHLVAEFARKVRDAGFTVYMPHMFGEAGRAPTPGYILGSVARACISREFSAFAANKSSPIVDWLRALAAHVHPLCGGKGVGAIGMCFTGNFALSLMLEPSVVAPVLSQPSLPLFQ
ncbi:MAG: dienelactone hydrolase family protein, partial [Pseudomonadales bacterium]|nr:dienelactone hydrolase family protein [Pseudomonadales bacterium]